MKAISLAKDVHQVLKLKNLGTRDATDIAKRRIKHHPFRHCFFTGDDDLQCTLYSALCSGSFLRKFCDSRCKVGTIPYRTVRMISRVGAQRPWNVRPDRRVHCTTKLNWNIMNCDYKKYTCLRKQWNCTDRSDTFLYDQSFRSQRWARFSLSFCLFVRLSCRP